MKAAMLIMIAMASVSIGSHAEDALPAWTNGMSRTIIGGDILHLGIGIGRTPEVARFKAEAMAVRNVITECSLAHRDIVIWDRHLEKLADDKYQAYARAGINFPTCDEAKTANGEQRKKLASAVLVENQDLYTQLEFAQESHDNWMGKLKAWTRSLMGKHEAGLKDLEERVRKIELKPVTVVQHNTIIKKTTVLVGGKADTEGRYRDCVQEYDELMHQAQALAQDAYPRGNLASPEAGPTYGRAMRKRAHCLGIRKRRS